MSYTICHISLNAIAHNFLATAQQTDALVGAVVKADAYGHGLIQSSRVLEDVGCSFFFVGSVQEGATLRSQGIKKNIIALLGIHSEKEKELCIEYNIIPICCHKDDLLLLTSFPLPIAIKYDTGMGRLGFSTDTLQETMLFAKKKSLRIEYLISHLSFAEDTLYTKKQLQEFLYAKEIITTYYPNILFSLSNSTATRKYRDCHFDIVRCGLILYGYSEYNNNITLEPAMQVQTRILQYKTVKKGSYLSYNNTFIAPHDMNIAIIAAGYADAYKRLISKGMVLINGHFAPILGSICMQSTLVDITHIENVTKNTLVFLMHPSLGLDATALAKMWDTIPYEVLCLLGKNTRVFHS
ncbi:MAG: alanine racemase [Desulfovibrionaceae bacterium]